MRRPVRNGPRGGIIKAKLKEYQFMYSWLTRSMYKDCVKALKKKKSSTNSMVKTASSSTNNEAPPDHSYKKAARPMGTTVKAKHENQKKIQEMTDAIIVRYKQQCQDKVKNDPNRKRVPRGGFNQIVAEEQKLFGLEDFAVRLPPAIESTMTSQELDEGILKT